MPWNLPWGVHACLSLAGVGLLVGILFNVISSDRLPMEGIYSCSSVWVDLGPERNAALRATGDCAEGPEARVLGLGSRPRQVFDLFGRHPATLRWLYRVEVDARPDDVGYRVRTAPAARLWPVAAWVLVDAAFLVVTLGLRGSLPGAGPTWRRVLGWVGVVVLGTALLVLAAWLVPALRVLLLQGRGKRYGSTVMIDLAEPFYLGVGFLIVAGCNILLGRPG